MLRPVLLTLALLFMCTFAERVFSVEARRSSTEDPLVRNNTPGMPPGGKATSTSKKKPPKKPVNKPCDSERFDGEDRKAAKLSVGSGQVETFSDLPGLIKTLPSDKSMGASHKPPISTDSTSTRVSEEERNVTVKQAWIFTYTREGDEDYHVILGTDPKVKKKVFFDLEVSGLPPTGSPSEPTLKKVREDFTKHFGITGCIKDYTDSLFAHPVEVEVTGSLFFDQFHYEHGDSVGHKIAKPKRFWEIHPATEIKFK